MVGMTFKMTFSMCDSQGKCKKIWLYGLRRERWTCRLIYFLYMIPMGCKKKHACDIPYVAYTPPPPAHSGWGDAARWWHPAADKASPLGGSQPTARWASGWKTACRISQLTPDGKEWKSEYKTQNKKAEKFLNFSIKPDTKQTFLDCNPTWSLSWVSLQHFHCWKTSASLSRPAWWKWRILYWLSLLAITSWPLVHASSLQQHNKKWERQQSKIHETRLW